MFCFGNFHPKILKIFMIKSEGHFYKLKIMEVQLEIIRVHFLRYAGRVIPEKKANRRQSFNAQTKK